MPLKKSSYTVWTDRGMNDFQQNLEKQVSKLFVAQTVGIWSGRGDYLITLTMS